ncbi:MAG TPA: hypothetical protein VFV23_01950 [Verrucomicrobiae bacterium]|nr:hypothetical protein [Verrucomicrobiae bacterium]
MKCFSLLLLPVIAIDGLFCGCATHQALTLSHNVNVPKEFRAGNFSEEHPGFIEGNSTVERYVNAYERGWVLAVERFADNIDFDDPSPFVMSGWPEESFGGDSGYSDGCARIRSLIEIYGEQKVSDYLQQFRPELPEDKTTKIENQIPASDAHTIASLNATANNAKAAPDERCRAIFSLFREFIKPGSTPAEVHKVLADTRWLEQTNILGIYVLGGLIPVKWELGHDTPFVLAVLPRTKPSTGQPPNLGYHLYFTLAGEADRSSESAFAILTGRQTSDTNAVLKEFALCYPDGMIEHVTKSGIRSFNFWPEKK